MKKTLISLFHLFLPLILGGIVAFVIKDSIDYSTLIKPLLAPPKILFPIVWTIIYLFMGISYYLYKKDYIEYSFIDTVYYLQLFVNCFWSFFFFLWKARFLAILWIGLLDILVFFLIYLFLYRKKISAYLNIPYLSWILFATYLTIAIYYLN